MAVFAVLLGLAIGSFLNVCIDRLPEGRSLIRPRCPHCPACRTRLAEHDLVPVVSYLFLRVRCRYCSALIPLRVPLVEAGSGLLFLLLWARFGVSPHFVFVAAVACVFIVALVIDFERRLIPNRAGLTPPSPPRSWRFPSRRGPAHLRPSGAEPWASRCCC